LRCKEELHRPSPRRQDDSRTSCDIVFSAPPGAMPTAGSMKPPFLLHAGDVARLERCRSRQFRSIDCGCCGRLSRRRRNSIPNAAANGGKAAIKHYSTQIPSCAHQRETRRWPMASSVGSQVLGLEVVYSNFPQTRSHHLIASVSARNIATLRALVVSGAPHLRTGVVMPTGHRPLWQ